MADNRRIRPVKKKKVELGNLKGRIKVVVRKRPMHAKEEGDIVKVGLGAEVRVNELKKRLDLSEYVEVQEFRFDSAFGERNHTEDVYEDTAKPLIDTFLKGGNASVFAYGQTGSGKTHTMIGDHTTKGMYILAAGDIFQQLQDAPGQLYIKASLFEIYCEKLIDLMGGKKQVHAREGADGVVKICGLTEHLVNSEDEMCRLVAASAQHRACGTTAANSQSSRSHAILRLSLYSSQERPISSLTFVDLAGSERGADTADRDKKTQREGSEINKSLLALKECIRAMDMGHKHVKFRGSKLTEVLKASFMGECQTCMVATISPSAKDSDHTMNTLRYAHRVKSLPPIKTKRVNRLVQQNVPLVAREGYKGEREVKEVDFVTKKSWIGGRKKNTALPSIAEGCCQHCGSPAHHTLLCRKPRHFTRPVTAPTPLKTPVRVRSPPRTKSPPTRTPLSRTLHVNTMHFASPVMRKKNRGVLPNPPPPIGRRPDRVRRAQSVPASMP